MSNPGLKQISFGRDIDTPPRLRSAVPPAMLDLDGIAKAVNYPPASLDSLSPDQLDRLSFVGYPERHGYNRIDLFFLIPKNDRYGKLDPPLSCLSNGERVRAWRKISRSVSGPNLLSSL